MTKSQFIKAISLILNFHSKQITLSTFLHNYMDGFSVVTFGDELIDIIIELINTALNIKDKELINWWLYENVEKVIYYGENKIKVKTIDELYDYILKG